MPEREEYKFLGWATSKEHADAEIVDLTDDKPNDVTNRIRLGGETVRVYAVWKEVGPTYAFVMQKMLTSKPEKPNPTIFKVRLTGKIRSIETP